jgi:large subunit ribosomal protein L18
VTCTSKELLKNGWDEKFAGSLKSIPAGYLIGLLMAKKIKRGKFVVDVGMARTVGGSRIFAVVKGLIDGGLDISANEKVFPTEKRISGEHLKPEVKAMVAKVREKLK